MKYNNNKAEGDKKGKWGCRRGQVVWCTEHANVATHTYTHTVHRVSRYRVQKRDGQKRSSITFTSPSYSFVIWVYKDTHEHSRGWGLKKEKQTSGIEGERHCPLVTKYDSSCRRLISFSFPVRFFFLFLLSLSYSSCVFDFFDRTLHRWSDSLSSWETKGRQLSNKKKKRTSEAHVSKSW